jgi:hypothetical protein
MNALYRFGFHAAKGIAHNTAKDRKPLESHSRQIPRFRSRAAALTAVALSVFGTQVALGDTAQASTTNDTVMVTSTSATNRTIVATTPLLAATTHSATPARTTNTAVTGSSYGCMGLLSSKQSMVMAFALGFCPSVLVLQYTAWGRSVVNWVVNGLCRVPWIVRAATGGRYNTC